MQRDAFEANWSVPRNDEHFTTYTYIHTFAGCMLIEKKICSYDLSKVQLYTADYILLIASRFDQSCASKTERMVSRSRGKARHCAKLIAHPPTLHVIERHVCTLAYYARAFPTRTRIAWRVTPKRARSSLYGVKGRTSSANFLNRDVAHFFEALVFSHAYTFIL